MLLDKNAKIEITNKNWKTPIEVSSSIEVIRIFGIYVNERTNKELWRKIEARKITI